MSKNQQYAERYAVEAMEQMKRYGIPASVTLAQLLEHHQAKQSGQNIVQFDQRINQATTAAVH